MYSGAVSIKMNVLLYAPPLFLLMLKVRDFCLTIFPKFYPAAILLKQPLFVPETLLVQAMDIRGVISALAGAALVQVLTLFLLFLRACLFRLEIFLRLVQNPLSFFSWYISLLKLEVGYMCYSFNFFFANVVR